MISLHESMPILYMTVNRAKKSYYFIFILLYPVVDRCYPIVANGMLVLAKSYCFSSNFQIHRL